MVIDPFPHLLQDSYRLRYQVYCVERGFLPAGEYPLAFESDAFDSNSIHVGAVDDRGHLAGTARLVLPIDGTLPTVHHCTADTIDRQLWGPERRWAEVSRLSVSRSYGDGAKDGVHPVQRGPILIEVSRVLYLASQEIGVTHWLVSIERSLQRLLTRIGFPLRQLGPEFDYLGPVAPYSLDLDELGSISRSGRFPQLAGFERSIEFINPSDESGCTVLTEASARPMNIEKRIAS
jgi:N-acyl amino acid synthase of PEP-CTERM/exosortase system